MACRTMSVLGVKLPDVGEGVAEAELVEWYVDVGDGSPPDTVLADVMTDKATVEISSPVAGVVTFRIGEPGEVLAVGHRVRRHRDRGIGPAATEPEARPVDAADPPAGRRRQARHPSSCRNPTRRPSTAPQPDADAASRPSRRHARHGRRASRDRPPRRPCGRERRRSGSTWRRSPARVPTDASCTPTSIAGSPGRIGVIGCVADRRLRAGRAPRRDRDRAASTDRRTARRRPGREIPHITYVDAVDATELEALRAELNRQAPPDSGPAHDAAVPRACDRARLPRPAVR